MLRILQPVKNIKFFLHPYFGFYFRTSKHKYVQSASIGYLKIRIEYRDWTKLELQGQEEFIRRG